MANKDIRDYANDKNVPLWKIVNRLHINDGNLSRKLRVELSIQDKAKIVSIIDDLSSGEDNAKFPSILDYYNQMDDSRKQLLLASAEQILMMESKKFNEKP